MSPLQKVALDKYLFIPEALASDQILLKNRTCDLKFRGGMKGNKEGMGSAAIFVHVYLMNYGKVLISIQMKMHHSSLLASLFESEEPSCR